MNQPRVTVVVADDSATMRRIVGGVLTAAGFDVVLAEDGVDAIQAVFATMPDVVVLDVQMPRVSGYVAARVLKDDWRTADLPVLFLTSLGAASDRYWGARAGGRLLGLLAMSSGSTHAFGESALTTLRLVAPPAAVVIDHARLAVARV